MTAEEVLDVPQGRFELIRHPVRRRQPLRAWDSADELVLGHLAEQEELGAIVIVNDAFGALSVALAPHGPVAAIDGENARIALAQNLKNSDLPPIEAMGSLELLQHGRAPIGTVVVKIPRSGGQLEDQLHRLRPLLDDETTVVGAGMARHIHSSTLELFETIIGPTTTSKATRKARLVHPTLDADLAPGANPWPKRWTHDGLTIVNHGGVFSAERLDNGTRLLLDSLPEVEPGSTVVDLGCGNGVVGMALARETPEADPVFVDESHRALASASEGWTLNFADRPARFLATDRLVNALHTDSVDLVVTNPPFHEDRAVGDSVAWEFFVDSHAVLRPGGSLVAVGNRHLPHHAKLAKIFGASTVIASDPKYVVHRAQKR